MSNFAAMSIVERRAALVRGDQSTMRDITAEASAYARTRKAATAEPGGDEHVHYNAAHPYADASARCGVDVYRNPAARSGGASNSADLVTCPTCQHYIAMRRSYERNMPGGPSI